MTKMIVELFEDGFQEVFSKEEKETVKELRVMLRRLARNENCTYGKGEEYPAFIAKWPSHGNCTNVSIAYHSDIRHFKVWFRFDDLKAKEPVLKTRIEECLAVHFKSLEKEWGKPPFDTINPSIPVSECVGKVKYLEKCLEHL